MDNENIKLQLTLELIKQGYKDASDINQIVNQLLSNIIFPLDNYDAE